jgi:anti-anti-sigma factor
MEMVTERRGIETILSFRGSMDTDTSAQAKEYLDGVVAAGARRLLLDFEHLDFMSSAGLRVLLGIAKTLAGGAGELRICNLDRNVREVFKISGFDVLLSVYESRAAAMEGWE